MLRLDQNLPRPENLVTNGPTVWWYTPADNTVQRYSGQDISGELKPIVDFLSGLGGLKGRFEVKLNPTPTSQGGLIEVLLTRLQAGGGPEKITVWFEPRDYALAGFRLTSALGETTDFKLSHVQLNTGLEDGRFTFRVPPGAEVIDQKSGGQ